MYQTIFMLCVYCSIPCVLWLMMRKSFWMPCKHTQSLDRTRHKLNAILYHYICTSISNAHFPFIFELIKVAPNDFQQWMNSKWAKIDFLGLESFWKTVQLHMPNTRAEQPLYFCAKNVHVHKLCCKLNTLIDIVATSFQLSLTIYHKC